MGRTGWSVAAERWDPVLRALVGAPRCPQRQALLLEMSEDVCRSCANLTCARAWARVMLVCVCCVCMYVPVRVRVQGPVSCAGSCLRACVVACVHVHGGVCMAWARVHMCLHAHAPAHVGVCAHV